MELSKLALSLLLGVTLVTGVRAQLPPQIPIEAILAPWEPLRYDPAEKGPLLVVRPFLQSRPASNSLTGYTDAFHGRLVVSGNLTVIAPRERVVLNTKPGPPNLFANMPAPERLKLFLGTCSEAQWKALGSGGLGLRDVTDEQKALFQSLLPVDPRLEEAELVPGDQPGSFQHENAKETPIASESLKLTLGLRSQYFFFEQGKRETTVSSGSDPALKAGKITRLVSRFESRQEGGAFGREIFLRQPNLPKPSALNYEALGQSVSLEGCGTLSEALKRVSEATGVELHADARIMPLPLYIRVAPGQTVAAGNLLKGLAAGVCGTYRQLAPNVFLLTDDIEGIGSRWVRIARWGEDADTERRELLEKATNQKRNFDPTTLISYRTDDPLSLPTALQDKLKATWRQGGYSLTLSTQDLPSALQQDIQDRMQYWKDSGRSMDDARLELRGAPRIGWLLPSGQYIEELTGGLSNGLGDTMIRDFAPRPTAPESAPIKPAAAPTTALPTVARRFVALKLATPQEAKRAVVEAKRLGLTDLYVQLTPAATDLAPLKAAIAQGKLNGIAVGVLVSLLRDEAAGRPEQTITLETGETFADGTMESVYVKRHPEYRSWMETRANAYRGWRSPGPQDEAHQEAFLRKLAALPDLSGIALKHTGGPGFAGEKRGGDGIDFGGELGFTPERRLAFLRKEGYDPIDIGQYSYALQKNPDLPFFPSAYDNVGLKRWLAFRQEETAARLIHLHGAIRQVNPKLALFISDRVSDYTDANTNWFGSWDIANRLPDNPVFAVRSEAMDAARKSSRSIFLLDHRQSKGDPQKFAASLERMGNKALVEKWNGIWVDLGNLSASDALSLLSTGQSR
ncbi:MAG: hypothetical protein QM758_01325 [Armatimonas sp.]